MTRFECKYYLTPRQYERVMRWSEPYIQPDAYSAGRPGHCYTISSLYLDSTDFRIGRMTMEGIKNRFKLRIRSYDDNPPSPIFFEIKRRMDGAVEKTRIPLRREEGRALLGGGAYPARVARGDTLHDLETFLGLMAAYRARPVMRVRYVREAYEARHGDPVRLTFDRDLAYVFTPDVNFSVNGRGWRTAPVPGIIFEIKFQDYYPFWVDELINALQLQRVSIAKYSIALEAARESRINPMAWEGII